MMKIFNRYREIKRLRHSLALEYDKKNEMIETSQDRIDRSVFLTILNTITAIHRDIEIQLSYLEHYQ